MELPVDYRKLTRRERRRVREEYVRRQQGLCHFCRAPLDEEPSPEIRRLSVTDDLFPVGFFDYPVHLHHDHATGLTLGAVHCYCNAVLWEHYGE